MSARQRVAPAALGPRRSAGTVAERRAPSAESCIPTADAIVRELTRRGELWEAAPGVVGLRGDALALFRNVERALAELARADGAVEWLAPPAIALETLARADYFTSFPHWLTAAAHLSDDTAELERVATSRDPAAAARDALAPATAALPPALCYHAYAALAGATVTEQLTTAQGTCWRHEGDRTRPLERGWAFTMRETVCVADEAATAAFVQRGTRRARALAAALGIEPAVEPATDPFFAPTAAGRPQLQRVKGLKHELLLPLGDGRRVAASSFNRHERFFGEAFGIGLTDGTPAYSACCAHGVERWTLALLVAHGPEARDWPSFDGLPSPLEDA